MFWRLRRCFRFLFRFAGLESIQALPSVRAMARGTNRRRSQVQQRFFLRLSRFRHLRRGWRTDIAFTRGCPDRITVRVGRQHPTESAGDILFLTSPQPHLTGGLTRELIRRLALRMELADGQSGLSAASLFVCRVNAQVRTEFGVIQQAI